MRKTDTTIGIEELAAYGLLQNLQLRPGKSGKFEVAAGGRRLAALKLLAKQKALSKLAEIGCNILDDDEDPVEISLAESSNREPMQPGDKFDAFKALAEAAKGRRRSRPASAAPLPWCARGSNWQPSAPA